MIESVLPTSWQAFSTECSAAAIGVDTAGNGPFNLLDRTTVVQVTTKIRQATSRLRRSVGDLEVDQRPGRPLPRGRPTP